MRMWMVNPELLCRKHLLGEHCECHMLAGALVKGKSIAGYLQRGQLEPALLYQRHTVLAQEMQRRGMNHRSDPAPVDVSTWAVGYVDPKKSLQDLADRCENCRQRQEKIL